MPKPLGKENKPKRCQSAKRLDKKLEEPKSVERANSKN